MRATVALFAVLMSAGSFTGRAAASWPMCPGGQFVVQGASLVPGGAPPGADAVSFSTTLVGLQSGCPAVTGRVRGTKKGTKVKVRWTSCTGLVAGAKLAAVVDAATCSTMTGTFRAPKNRIKTAFTATRTTSGSCTDDTFKVIQNRIFNYRGCNVTTCHGSFSGNPPQANLDLRPGAAYANLVGVLANNALAQAAGKLRVNPGDAAGSFLSQKVHGTQAAGEGSMMPLVGSPLPQIELDLIDAWINAGAPETGIVSGAPCLLPLQYEPSTAPTPPAGGYQLVLNGPTLLPGQEQEGCFWMPVPNATDFYASKFEFVLNPGTHHYSIFPYTFPGTPQVGVWRVNDYGCTSGAMFGNSLSGAPQSPYYVDLYPSGVARVLRAGGYIGLNAHYKNDFDVPIQMKVWTNVYPYAGTPDHIAQTLTSLDSTFTINVPVFTQRLQQGRFTNTGTQPMRFIQLAGHMHKHSLRFTAYNSSGTKIYETFDWSHPFGNTYDPASPSDLVVNPGDWISYECLEDNGVTRPVRKDAYGNPTTLLFGVSVEDEMCILVGAYILG
jgi:hypothetical protein